MLNFDLSSKRDGSATKEQTSAVLLKMLQQAQQTGTLNLSNRSLESVPTTVWNLNEPLPSPDGAAVVDLKRPSDGPRWWELQPITKLILTSNRITRIPGTGLVKLDTLTHLDLRDNQLVELPGEIGDLCALKVLVLSLNKLTFLPDGLGRLHELVSLDVANNQLESLNDQSFAQLTSLEKLDASENRLSSVSVLPPRLRQINLSHNRLEHIPAGLLEKLSKLQSLDLQSNQLAALVLDNRDPSARSGSPLVTLNVSLNRLTMVPDVTGLTNLKELFLSDNRICTLSFASFRDCPLVTLDLARNCIEQIPPGISATLPNLIRLDVSANELTNLPTELGLMKSLQVLLVERNPLRSIRQNIVSGGTNAIKELLRQRHVSVSEDASPDSSTPQSVQVTECTPVPEQARHSNVKGDVAPNVGRSVKTAVADTALPRVPPVNPVGVLQWSAAPKGSPELSLPELDVEAAWIDASASGTTAVRSLQLEQRMLQAFPMGIFGFASTLTTLNLSVNRITQLPDEIDRLVKLADLNLTRNLLRSLPMSMARLPELSVLCLDSNPLGPELPEAAIFSPPLSSSIQSLSLRSCKLSSVPSTNLLLPSNTPKLTHLDLSDNNIDTIPPELGLCTQLRSLQLTGNTFRIPRPAVLAQGTSAVLEYLRSRIPES
ncbi:hypothetical protein CRM22_003229 [Opisthorchis felineus]|uniref:Leucine-rich repeat-containing protein 40 n=1 Tax=Opisthorchis felineus TaxID=147828 RepID=A0A4S2M2A3_OPIFE|nr:hypothetical protein CRM22_003229 [Opisthorchis felineus]